MRNIFLRIAHCLLINCGVFDVCLNLTLAQYLPPPTVATGKATNITASSATLNGTVSPGRSPSVWFEYGTTSALYDKLTQSVSGPRLGTETVSIDISGLSAATTYYYKIAAKDNWPEGSSDTAYGDEKSFTTLEATATPTPSITPTVIPTTGCEGLCTEDATDITSSSATLNGEMAIDLAVHDQSFEYGTGSGAYISTIGAITDSFLENKLKASISGLLPATTYYYRLAAEGKSVIPPYVEYMYGSEKFFSTLEATPECEVKFIKVFPKRLVLQRGESKKVIITLSDKGNCSLGGKIVTVMINKIGSKYISVKPKSWATNIDGKTEFVVRAYKEGKTRITFKVDNLKKSITVKVRKAVSY